MSRTLLAALLLVLAGCGSEPPPTAKDPAGSEVRTVGIVSAPGAGMTPALRAEIHRLEQRHPAAEGRALISRVVHVGCLTATAASVSVHDGRVSATAHVDDGDIQCVTALTSAVVLDVPTGYR